MKKIILFMITMAFSVMGLTSCLDSDGAEATVQYYVNCDSIVYQNPNDAQYDSIIKNALYDLQFCYYNFSESSKSQQSDASYALNECDIKAYESFSSSIKKGLALSDIENQLYKSNSNYFSSKGVNNASEIGLSSLTVYMRLWGTYTGAWYAVGADSCKITK